VTKPLLVIGDRRDPLAAAFSRSGKHAIFFTQPRTFSASFTVDRDGTVTGGVFVVDGRHRSWDTLGGVLVRPGRAWSMPSHFTTLSAGMRFHEQRTAWCAALKAFPGVVLDRLPPAWFLDQILYGMSLTDSLSATLDDRVARRSPGDTPMQFASVTLLGQNIFAEDPHNTASVEFGDWLSDRHSLLSYWQRSVGVHVASIGAGRRDLGWTIESVNPLPGLKNIDPAMLDARCQNLLALFA
jgi:hypothetical protein